MRLPCPGFGLGFGLVALALAVASPRPAHADTDVAPTAVLGLEGIDVPPALTDDISEQLRQRVAASRDMHLVSGKDLVEVKIGYDGIVLANSVKGTLFKVTRKDLYLALAKQVPDPANPAALVANPYKTWNQVNKALPADRIEVLGPPPTSGTRDAFVELVMEAGCQNFAWIKSLKDVDEGRFKRVCDSIREDGAYVEAGENDNLIVQKLDANPKAIGIFGYSFLEENLSKVEGSHVDGVPPTFENDPPR